MELPPVAQNYFLDQPLCPLGHKLNWVKKYIYLCNKCKLGFNNYSRWMCETCN